jgi:hypothetical protein
MFRPDIYNSQVVCAINDKIEYYENIFSQTRNRKNIADEIKLDKISKKRINDLSGLWS